MLRDCNATEPGGDQAVRSFPPPGTTQDTESSADIHLAGKCELKSKPKQGRKKETKIQKNLCLQLCTQKVRVQEAVCQKQGLCR